MTTHAVVMLRITAPDNLAQYREVAAEALARHGGEVVQASPDIKVLEGNPVMPDMMAVLRFADRASAQAWMSDPDLAAVHGLRRDSGSSEVLLL